MPQNPFSIEIISLPSQQKPVQRQKNNVRTTFTGRCSDVILLTLNRFWSAGLF